MTTLVPSRYLNKIGFYGNRKPLRYFRPIKDHPFLRDCGALYTFREGAGDTIRDHLGLATAEATVVNDAVWTQGGIYGEQSGPLPESQVLEFPYGTIAALVDGSEEVGVVVHVKIDKYIGTSSTQNRVVAVNIASGKAAIIINIRADGASAGKIIFGARSQQTDTYRQFTSPDAIPLGKWITLGILARYRNDEMMGWIDGRLLTTGVTTFGSDTFNDAGGQNNNDSFLGHRSPSAGDTYAPTGVISLAAFYFGKGIYGAVDSMARNPWEPFESPMPRLFVDAPAAAAGGFFARRYYDTFIGRTS